MRVLFWGTPAFAAPALRALLGEGFDVIGAVTQPDKPQGRSRSQLVASPVKQVALEESLPVFQPEKPRADAEFLEMLELMAPDVSVVVAYGHILPKRAIDAPRLGTVNIHASLLPALRGAAPIQAAIRDGLTETGVTIMRMVPALDAGPMILRCPVPIAHDETYGELALRLSELGAQAVIEALTLMSLGAASEEEQEHALATYAPKVDRATTAVPWAEAAEAVARFVRAYDPRPGAWTTLRGADVKLFGGRAEEGSGRAGEVIAADAGGLLVACGAGAGRVKEVQPAGKRRLTTAEWARGRGVTVGDQLGA
jgi:methionyl-tRNA formyltransferase